MGTSQQPGLLITFEGTEGAGKSTLIRKVAENLTQSGVSVIMTREPGGSDVAERIRTLILEQNMNPWTELFLYEAARAEHMARTVHPALADGAVVLCDRFTDSTLAYQGHARGLPKKAIQTLNQFATGGVKPDLTVFLDIDPAKGLARAAEQTRFEKEGVKFQMTVRKGFLWARALRPSSWLTLKVENRSPDVLAQSVIKRVLPLMEKKRRTQTRRRSRV